MSEKIIKKISIYKLGLGVHGGGGGIMGVNSETGVNLPDSELVYSGVISHKNKQHIFRLKSQGASKIVVMTSHYTYKRTTVLLCYV